MKSIATVLFVVAWGLYAMSLFVPCARIQNLDGEPGQAPSWDGTHEEEAGFRMLQIVFCPVAWLFVYPLVSVAVNLAFILMPLTRLPWAH